MNPKYSIERIISEGVSLTRRGHSPKPGFRVLSYHAIGENVAFDPKKLFTVPSELFSKEIEDLRQMKDCYLKEFSLYEFLASDFKHLNVSLIFDDGYKSVIKYVVPTLKRFEIPFTVFISTGFIEAGNSEFLSKEDILELSRLDRVKIGSHGVNHIPLADCTDSQLEYELKASKVFLEDLINHQVNTFSYPYGSASPKIKKGVHEAGYELALTSRSDINWLDRDPLFLCRTDILAPDSLRTFYQKLCGCWDWGRWKSPDPAFE
ncbi:polysaccharide deacetylase family protein [Acidobacteriota bacterium]